MKLDGKVALITGAGSGFGRASALLFAREGAKVVLVDVDENGAVQTGNMLGREGRQGTVVLGDVAKAADAERMVQETLRVYGRLDVLFNNAGIGMPHMPSEQVPEDLWERVLAVNLKGVFLGCKYAIPLMKRQGGGVILNTASMAGVRPRVGALPYAASKGGVITLTKALAVELAPYRIRVNCLAPVAADTPLFFGMLGENREAGLKAFLETIPWGRIATADDIAQAALFLVSDAAEMITGTCLQVDGGRGL
ncbi:MAG TPA: SDR family oxidoreductase [Alphaproteobacteria bacterium]|nr:SDR family oxidoreductase [Alphaproteobacteria bacterium]